MHRKVLLCLLVLLCISLFGCSYINAGNEHSQVIINEPTGPDVNGYRDGENRVTIDDERVDPENIVPIKPGSDDKVKIQYCANIKTKVFHLKSCSAIKDTAEENKLYLSNREELLNSGFRPCKKCNP